MEKSQAMPSKAAAQACNPILTLGGRVSQGTALTVLAVAAVGSGLALGWDSLAALGLTTVIISLLPCLAMCALGVCANRMGKRGAGIGTQATPPKETQPPAAEILANVQPGTVEGTRSQ